MSASDGTSPAVTVLIPVFNAGRPLKQAIDSILAQTFEDFELLIIEDASTDGSRDLVREYAARDRRVTALLHDQNRGLAATLNEGLSRAAAPLVARMDQDDESLPDRLERQTRLMWGSPDITVAGSSVYYMGARPEYDRLYQVPLSEAEIRSTLLSYNCMYHPSVILRRDVIRALGGYRVEFKNAEDYDLWLRVSRHHRIVNQAQPVLRYRFTIAGMTLGRKWEQLSYVYLAQAAHTHDSVLDEQTRVEAQRMLAETDRAYFFREVAKGTLSELVQLHMWSSAIRLALGFSEEIGRRETARLLRVVVGAYVRSVVRRPLPA